MARSLNRVQLIGNLTRDPELRYTPSGTAVCTFSLATNRSWTTDTGEKKDEVEFHRVVAWNKLAELCSQFLTKGRKVFVEGRLATRSWSAQDGTQKQTTEIVISDMILLDSKREGGAAVEPTEEVFDEEKKVSKKPSKKEDAEEVKDEPSEEEIAPDDIPF
jgi:single-strand DNA-binding protein